jgi:hypothetical protein
MSNVNLNSGFTAFQGIKLGAAGQLGSLMVKLPSAS